MDARATFRTLAHYNRWMNERLYAACASIPDEQRKRDRRAYFRSIHGTLNHLLLGDRLWLGRFTARPFRVRSLKEELYGDFATLRRERVRTDVEIEDYAGSLSAEALGASILFTSVVGLRERSYPLWVVVLHFFNHQTHHRGQLTTLLSQCGVDPGLTDLMWLPGEAWSQEP
jgi:uncharacterized damage-inducible protein DinB